MERFTIELLNGTVLTNVWHNGSMFVYDNTLDKSTFDNLSNVKIIKDNQFVVNDMKLTSFNVINNKTFFKLEEVTNEEAKKKASDEFIQFVLTNIMPEEQQLKMAVLFDSWKIDTPYSVGIIVRYQENLYKCVQAHTSQADWTPSATPALWARISDPTQEWPEWIQPTGAHDAYAKGDKVSHNGKHWVSDVDGNVWEPGVSQWTEAS